jgi:flavin reductase (DIM6/NTAB) family NADH-FMN oxidoreductase RutF
MQDDFRRVMARFATGVTVMTTRAGDAPHGMTANAVASVSLDPLLLLVCVERTTYMSRMVRESGVFALSILAADQRELSNRFADRDRPMGAAQFAGIPTTTGPTGTVVLADAIAWVDCRVWAIHDGGDHEIVVGEVVDLGVGRDAPPLGYFRSAYVPVGEE